MDTNAAIAFSRFGLGRRKDELVPSDAKAYLRTQLQGPDRCPSQGLLDSSAAIDTVMNLKEAHRNAEPGQDLKVLLAPERGAFNTHNRAEEAAALSWMISTPDGFRERLVWFWFNHFTVASRGRFAAACVGPYVREAIRPHVTGKFRDMLFAVMRHPAMLAYLDQFRSVGPDSPRGERTHKGLNENLARECLELHTVTPAAGYTQTDVTNFARILTGWTIDIHNQPHMFRYDPASHEPGQQVILGRTWPDGEEGGIALLTYLASHPATQRHLAEKLVRHFVADDPPPGDVTRVEAVLRETDGDLREAALAIIDLPGAWQPMTKLRSPLDYVVTCMRVVGAHPEAEPHLADIVKNLGEPLFKAPFPIGWPDRASDWSNPEAVLQRVDFAYQFAGRVTDQEPVNVAEASLGPLLQAETLDQIRRAGSRQEGLALLLASPEFQRR